MTTIYNNEKKRIKKTQAELEKIKRSMNPAWRGLSNHPDEEILKVRLGEINRSVKEAIDKCGWFLWELEGMPED